MNQTPYIEEEALQQYLWHNFYHLTTRFEGLAMKAADAGIEGESIMQTVIDLDDPNVISAFHRRSPDLRRLIMARITRDHPNEVIINRCPSCNRIVATPKAQQCLWCFHDWHPSA